MSSDLKIGVRLFFFFFFFGFLFFFSFLRSTLDEITKRYVKNYGGVFEKKRKKRRKNTVLMEKRKKIQKKRKARTGFEPAIFGSPWQPSCCLTRPTPYHLATEPLTQTGGKIKAFKPSTQNAHSHQLNQITIILSSSYCNPEKLNRFSVAARCAKNSNIRKEFEQNKRLKGSPINKR